MRNFFSSLNCTFCKEPFEIEEGPRYPIILSNGKVICYECFDKVGEDDFKVKNPSKISYPQSQEAYFIIDLLKSGSFNLLPDKTGYYLIKPFEIPRCVLCQEIYSLDQKHRPFILKCAHSICSGCVPRIKLESDFLDSLKYQVFCPFCKEITYFNDNGRKNQFIKFLKELPKMHEQYERGQSLGRKDCEECGKKEDVDEMFQCKDCDKKICGACTVRKHSGHRIRELFRNELKNLAREGEKMIDERFNEYEDTLRTIQSDLIGKSLRVKTRMLARIERLGEKERYLEAITEFDHFKQTMDQLDSSFSKFQEAAEEFEQGLQGQLGKETNYWR